MISRRKFLMLAGAAAAATMLPVQISAKQETPSFSGPDLSKYRWAMVVDVAKCTECVKELIEKTGNPHVKPPCVIACDLQNNVPDFKNKDIDPQWMRIAKFEFESPNAHGKTFYMPLMCNQCEYPPCCEVCPTKASFQRPDGIVMIDIHRCIGCRYCMIACPYGARSFNFKDPREGLKEVNPIVPMRAEGVVEKCMFCVEIVDRALVEGKEPVPACVAACKMYSKGALTFGNLKDPNSEVSKLVRNNYVVQLRPQFGTDPHVYYINIKPGR